MSTLRDMITAAFRKSNIFNAVNAPKAKDFNNALYALDNWISLYSTDPLMIYSIQPYIFPVVGGQKIYTLGPGGQWNVNFRPIKINDAYVIWNDPNSTQAVDIHVELLTVDEYAGIGVKDTISTYEVALYDDNAMPLRNITLFPIPNQSGNIRLWLIQPLMNLNMQQILALGTITPGTLYTNGFYQNVQLTNGSGTGAQANITVMNGGVSTITIVNAGVNYAVNDVLTASSGNIGGTGSGFSVPVSEVSSGLDDPINFPPGYEYMLVYNLAIELSFEYSKPLPPGITQLAQESIDKIKGLNNYPMYRTGDGGLNSSLSGEWNWISGQFSFWTGNR